MWYFVLFGVVILVHESWSLVLTGWSFAPSKVLERKFVEALKEFACVQYG